MAPQENQPPNRQAGSQTSVKSHINPSYDHSSNFASNAPEEHPSHLPHQTSSFTQTTHQGDNVLPIVSPSIEPFNDVESVKSDPLQQNQLFPVQPSLHTDLIAVAEDFHTPLTSSSIQQRRAVNLTLRPHDSRTLPKISTAHIGGPSVLVPTESQDSHPIHCTCHQRSTILSEHIEPLREPTNLTVPTSVSDAANLGSSDQRAATIQHEQASLTHPPTCLLQESSLQSLSREKRDRSTSSSSDESWEDPLLCRQSEKRRRIVSSARDQPWEDPLLCSPPRTQYPTVTTPQPSTESEEEHLSDTSEEGLPCDSETKIAVSAIITPKKPPLMQA